DPNPACDATNGGEHWEPAQERDLIRRDPCDYCFPDADGTDEIDAPLDHLVICPGQFANKIHIDEDHGEPFYGSRDDQSDLARRLEQADPDDLDLRSDPRGDA
ncbi:MAG: hypothetical protein V5A39_13150, partial [Haloarculaceae archaeon]